MINQLPRESRFGCVKYLFMLILFGAAAYGVMALYQNIMLRKQEALQTSFALVKLTEDTIDPKEWGKNFPRQYDSYLRTVDVERTRHGGSEAFQKLEEDPLLKTIFAGYAFGVDYREERGHAYMLRDQDITERMKVAKQPGACLQCHASALKAYREAGVKAGVPDDDAHRQRAAEIADRHEETVEGDLRKHLPDPWSVGRQARCARRPEPRASRNAQIGTAMPAVRPSVTSDA